MSIKVKKISLHNVKSFKGYKDFDFDEGDNIFAVSGRNGSGKTTILKSLVLFQKAFFVKYCDCNKYRDDFEREVFKFLSENHSSIKIILNIDGKDRSFFLKRRQDGPFLWDVGGAQHCIDDLGRFWNSSNPSSLILFIDASKSFSEDSVSHQSIGVSKVRPVDLLIESIFYPDRVFSNTYQRLVNDYISDRLVPLKPDRLLYYKVASKLFNDLIPEVELSNFSGKHKDNEFVLLGKGNRNIKQSPYDIRDFSSGEKALFCSMVYLCISASIGILIVDEPENHFHEELLIRFSNALEEFSTKGHLVEKLKGLDVNRQIKSEWIRNVYGEHKVDQIFYLTHSKPLIYKIFSTGKNYYIDGEMKPLVKSKAEDSLREMGLSTVYNKILFVEGKGDASFLESVVSDLNVRIKVLGSCQAVCDAFEKLSLVEQDIHDSIYCFMIDRDGKDDDYFKGLRKKSPKFYDNSFIVLDKHEFENYFLDEKLLVHCYNMLDDLGDGIDEGQVKKDIVEEIDRSKYILLRKESALRLQYIAKEFLLERISGREAPLDDIGKYKEHIEEFFFQEDCIEAFKSVLLDEHKAIFDKYSGLSEGELFDNCDGKKVLSGILNLYSKKLEVKTSKLKRVVHTEAKKDHKFIASNLIGRIQDVFS
ncbi:AAA family ATPase [Pontibacterium sp. N1Y112]|uniref:AAA family ATPase n=1 Tax=Pontibacterium sinense TaxID=2781979 RepID=A0A8J7JZE8_9GAMM|nr:AAA family ATPase [Pontibacterium sinense]MBE9398703.1 AAA family ATPase [Pontibacterium sinense]